MKSNKVLLYAVTDRSWLNGVTLASQVEEALKGGITMLQFREKQLSNEEFYKEAKTIQALCFHYQVPFLINDQVKLACQLNADGVHVGQSDMAADQARKEIGKEKILGVSVQTEEQAILAEQQGADYLGVGAIFPTSSKADAKAVEKETLRQICQAVSIPVVAIGGITKENIKQLIGTGISGIAVIRAIFAEKEIQKATLQLKEKAKLVCKEIHSIERKEI